LYARSLIAQLCPTSNSSISEFLAQIDASSGSPDENEAAKSLLLAFLMDLLVVAIL
jgi:hypothetical protein